MNGNTSHKKKAMGVTLSALRENTARYGKEAADTLEWLWHHIAENGDTLHVAAEILGVSETTVSRVLSGSYGADIGNFIFRINTIRIRTERARAAKFINSESAHNIHNVLDRCRNTGGMGFIHGPARRGKTFSAKKWIEENNRNTRYRAYYLDVTSLKTMKAFLIGLAKTLGLSTKGGKTELAMRIQDALDYRFMLIVDEIGRLLKMRDPTEAMEFLRQLYDQQHVPIVLMGTPWTAAEISSGRLHIFFEQLEGRLEEVLKIPDNVSRREISDFLKGYCKNPTSYMLGIATTLARGTGRLASLARHLGDAKLLAGADGRTEINDDDLAAAVAERSGAYRWSEE